MPIEDILQGSKLQVKKQSVCERFIHEMTNYQRDGYRKKDMERYTLHPGDEVEFVREFNNFFGTYWTVKKGDMEYDVKRNAF